MISLIAVDPSFGGSYNLKKAFQAIDDVALICTHLDKWRKREPGTIDYVVGPKGNDVVEASQVVRNSRLVFFVGGTAIDVAKHLDLSENEWGRLNTAAWFTDTPFSWRYDEILNFHDDIRTKKYFVLVDSNYWGYCPEGTIPLEHAISIATKGRRASRLTVVHSPGTVHKRPQKGSDEIEQVIKRLHRLYDFDYKCLMKLPHEECLKEKAQAHIVIDKIIGSYGSDALSKSALEGMAMGAVAFCPFPPNASVITTFSEPPMFKPRTPEELEMALSYALSGPREELERLGDEGRRWIEKYWALENGAWLRYFTRFVDL